jgi:hypothetical protein
MSNCNRKSTSDLLRTSKTKSQTRALAGYGTKLYLYAPADDRISRRLLGMDMSLALNHEMGIVFSTFRDVPARMMAR